jgi:putative acetyltransferase
LEIREDDLSSQATRDLLRLHLDGMHAHSPAGSVFALDLSGLTATTVTVWTAWIDGDAVGMGALKDLGDGTGEIKSMRACRWRIRSQAAIGSSNRPWQCCCQP